MTSPAHHNFQVGLVSPPPNYQHTRSSAPASFSSFQSVMSPPKSQSSHRQHTYPYPHQPHQPLEDEHYLAKYKDMKQKVKELELDNDRLHVKCLSVRKNIQRLRLERAILYERLQAIGQGSNSNTISQNVPPHHVATGHSDPVQAREQPQLLQSTSINHPASIPHRDTPFPPVSAPISSAPPPPKPLAYTLSENPVPTSSFSSMNQSGQKRNVTTTGSVNMNGSTASSSFSPPFHEVRNGNYMKTFPFVHEYSTTQPGGRQQTQRRQQRQEEAITSTIFSEYPIEIKFHQYEGGSPERQSGQRGRRETDRDEKGGKQRRRVPQDLDKAQQTPRKPHATTFRDQFTYSFQAHPMPQRDLTQPGYGSRLP